MKFENINNVYLLGIGGIGMSALARFFKSHGMFVAGYDKTETALTKQLINEDINIHYNDEIALISDKILNDKEHALLIYTPAIPNDNKELNFFRLKNFKLYKRAEVLGIISNSYRSIAVAGTHGKTTVSTEIAHIFMQSANKCNAILGGIAKNYNTNLLLSESSKFFITEADEYDRSFLHLHPNIAIITSIDADHLDIYGNFENLKSTFIDFVKNIDNNGILIIKKGLNINIPHHSEIRRYYYSLDETADFYAKNIRKIDKNYIVDIITPGEVIHNIEIGFPGLMNVENAVAAFAVSYLAGININNIRIGIAGFKGVKRRFDYQILTNSIVYIDDYAHHPEELKACINSVKELYPEKKITAIFQPHLFTRTRDFADEFANALQELDELILLDIYPAREQPIEGVSAKLIYDLINLENKCLCNKADIIEALEKENHQVVLTLGAGDIDKEVERIKNYLMKRFYS